MYKKHVVAQDPPKIDSEDSPKKTKKDKKKDKKAIKKKKGKKRKREQEDDEQETKTTPQIEEPAPKKAKTQNFHDDKQQPFRRVKQEEVRYAKADLRDNSFQAKLGSRGDWGGKANEILRKVRGKDFRHEKTKKKRGTYRGGTIDTSIKSIKFDD
eukprot:TRINITY_DN1963_c0_g1_i1.p2 TRINITY_DN1963_c0_g1~~TRINITY_DN1963_c0_g1_i1.p2  ORF type:complete len:155 (-),score=54.03 TRINITY_DN1963_c0_g1_i1:41-505(-)